MKKTAALILAALMLTSALSSCGKDDVLTYRYNYDLSEYITLADYKGLEATGYNINITDDDIQTQILSTRSYYSRITDVDRPAELYDTLYIDYSVIVDGEIDFSAGEHDCELLIGSGSMPDGFEENLIGAKAGDELSFELTFPDTYQENPAFAGKTVEFDVTVTRVCMSELPEYTDDFVRAYLGCNTTEEYEEKVREGLEEHYKEIYYQSIDSQIWDTIIENTTVIKYPTKELDELKNEIVSSVEAAAKSAGVTLDAYVQVLYGTTLDEYYDNVDKDAKDYVKDEMVKYAIARAENLDVTDEEYAAGAEDYAKNQYNLSSATELEELYDKKMIRQALLYDKVHRAVVDYANVTLEDFSDVIG